LNVTARSFAQAIARGGVHADAKMADRLYVRGLGYRHKAEKIFHDRENGGVIRASYEEHYPPDTNAALAWLARRQPGRWKERQEVSVTGTIAHRLAAMTPAERGAFAADLVAQAKRRLLEAGVVIDQEPARTAELRPGQRR